MPTLAKYRQMRDFAKTSEPRGGASKRLPRPEAALTFVVQKHDARNLHFDFRLELDGVLLSWAVPKGPSLDPSVKRLAMEVEPHPLEYGGFEGTIPKGEYGGGTVMVWDRGTWAPEGDPRQGLAKGHLRFSLHGERLKGAWHLVRTRGKADDGHGNHDSKPWLLFKSRDAAATDADTVLSDYPNSVVSGRSFDEIAAELGELEAAPDSEKRPKKRAKRAAGAAVKPPATLAPELATLVDAPPEGDDWIHEIKFDGYRVLARIEDGEVTLLTRNGKDWTARMSSLQSALEGLAVSSAILDGELVALNDKGLSDFQTLQNSLKDGQDEALVYYAFDLPFGPGGDLRDRPLVERKSLLRELLEKNEPPLAGKVRFSAHVVGSGPEFFRNAGKLGLEGTIAKRASSPYHSGRGRDWLKVKCGQRQEFTIVGYTQPGGSRTRFGALLVGTQRDGALVYAGRVGTGFSQASLDDVHARLQPLAVDEPAVANPPRGADARGVQWVEPRLVAEVAFTEMTQEGLLRHPSFQGLREDKPAQEVNMETAVSIESRAVSTRKFPITNPSKVLFPAQGITKQELLEYYAVVAKRMLPHVKNRPLTLVRCPNGYGKPCFFQKHPGNTATKGLRDIAIREKEGKSAYSALDDAQGLFALVQLGALEIHTWGSRADDFEHPDLLVFDLDPDPSVDYSAVIAGARAVREVFEHAGLETFVKTTGGKGLHVCVPIRPDLSWDEAKDFTSRVAHAIAERSPGLYVATQSKAKRKGKTFIDYLRNGRGATFVAPYSTRAREGAPIAVPLEWDELSPKLPPDHFNLRNIKKRLSLLKKDPFERMSHLAQRLVPERTKP